MKGRSKRKLNSASLTCPSLTQTLEFQFPRPEGPTSNTPCLPINRLQPTIEQRVLKIVSEYQRGLANNCFLKLSCRDLKLGKERQNGEPD